jgi:hypothetical protein
VGKQGKGQLYIKNPQIINGGQTAYTLSKIYADNINNPNISEIFNGKEVMLKIITFSEEDYHSDSNKRNSILHLIEDVSKATNQQTEVVEADRRSNDKIQILMQEKLYNDFGYFYERKKGEYYDGVQNNYVDKNKIIRRGEFIRLSYAVSHQVSKARRNSENVLFRKDLFDGVFNDIDKSDNYFLAYLCFKKLEDIQIKLSKSKNRDGIINYGQGLRYGKYAIISAIFYLIHNEPILKENIEELSEEYVLKTLSVWIEFEKYAMTKPHNSDYFYEVSSDGTSIVFEANYDNYYKGRNIDLDIFNYFSSFDYKRFNADEIIKERNSLYNI